MSTINITGTGGIIEGNLGTANVNVNLDRSLMFDGTNDFIDCGTDTDHDFTDHFTLACWAKNDNATTTGGDREHLIAKYEGSNDKRIFRLYLHGSTLRFGVGYNSGNSSVEITHSMTGLAEHWNHYAASFDGGVMKLYVNGVLVTNTDNGPSGTNTLSAIHANNAIELEIGAYQSGNHTWTGQIADVRIYNAVLTNANIQLLASKINTDSSLGAGTTNLKGYWKLNNETASGGGSGTGFIVDESGTVNQGTLTNFSGTYWDYDAYSVDVYDNSTTTDGTFTVTQGKVEGKALSHLTFDGSNDYAVTSDDTVIIDDVDSTIAFWYKGASPGSGKTIMESRATANDGLIYTRLGTELRYYTSASGEFGLDASEVTACGLYDDEWHHVAFVLEHGGNLAAQRVYVDGVSRTLTEVSTVSLDVTWRGFKVGGQLGYINAELRDIKVFDYPLSADQASSLYSNTYPQTAKHYWKFDEGTGASAKDSGTATDQDLTINGATYTNGTLDLDGTLTIAANGTLSAPRGDLSLAAATTFAANTFVHNNGRVVVTNAGTVEYRFSSDNAGSDNPLYDFQNQAAGQVRFLTGYIIENSHSHSGGNSNNYLTSNRTYNYGTTSSAASVTTLLRSVVGTASSYANIYGVSSLYPVTISVWDDTPLYTNVGLKNVNVTTNITQFASTSNGNRTVRLDGDCEFDAVTVDSGDTLDLNGQRAEFSGNFTSTGNVNGGGLIFAGGDYSDGNGSGNSFTSKTLVMDGGYCNPVQTTWENIFLRSGTHTIGGVRTWTNTPLFVGGTTNFTSNNTWGNITLATGSTMNGNDDTITCSGDFTTSGGLIGKSAMVVSGDNDYEGMSVTELQAKGDWNFSGSEGLTIEGWFKFDDLDFGSGNDAILAGHVRSGDTTGKRYGCGLQIMDDKVMAIAANNDTAHTHFDNCSFPVTDMTAGKWHHLAMTVDANDSSTPLTKLYLDGKLKAQVTGVTTVYFGYNFVVGGYADNHDSQGWTNRRMDGCIARASCFRQEMTAAQLRSMMFTDYTAMAALSSGVDEAKTVGWWQFDEGTGTAVDNKGTAGAPPSGDHSNFDGVIASAGTTWAGAGTFTYGTSTLVMAKSGTQTINCLANSDVNNLTVNDGSTTQIHTINNSAGRLDVFGNFIINEKLKPHADSNTSGVTIKTADKTFSVGSDVKSTAIAELYQIVIDHTGNTNIPECQIKILDLDNQSTVTATGNLTVTTELEVNSGTTFNANTNTINTKKLDTKSGSTTDLRNSNLTFKVTTSGDSMSIDPSSTILSGNTLVEGFSVSSPTTLSVNSTGGIEIVGDVKFLKMQSGGDLTVIGSVVGCQFDDTTGNIRQWHHTLDTQQLLDADEAGDDDLRLTKPALDNALELMTK